MGMLIMEELLQAFSFKMLWEAMNIMIVLKQNKISNEDFIAFVTSKPEGFIEGVFPNCPECGIKMTLLPGDSNDSHWICMRCRYSRYNPVSMRVMQKRLLKQFRNLKKKAEQ